MDSYKSGYDYIIRSRRWGKTIAYVKNSGSLTMTPDTQGNLKVGINQTNPTAWMHLPSGGTGVGFGALKFASGVLLATPQAGAIEFDGTNLWFTDATPSRGQVTLI